MCGLGKIEFNKRIMAYNPKIHRRRSIRLKGYDYSKAGAYFITICVHGGKSLFGEIVGDEMILNDLGKIAYEQWAKLSERFKNMELDVFQIMPNHMHGIIVLNDFVGATLAVAPDETVVAPDKNTPDENAIVPDKIVDDNNMVNDIVASDAVGAGVNPAPTNSNPNTIGDIVGAYKSLVSNECLDIYKSKNEIMGKLWQRNYYENIIRDERAYQNISNYIINNPKNWKGDKFNKR
jgi:putative transposase